MAKNENNTNTQNNSASRSEKAERERLDVFCIRDGEKMTIWTKVGAAFVNGDGSLNVFLDALPIGGKLHIRKAAIRSAKNDKHAA